MRNELEKLNPGFPAVCYARQGVYTPDQFSQRRGCADRAYPVSNESILRQRAEPGMGGLTGLRPCVSGRFLALRAAPRGQSKRLLKSVLDEIFIIRSPASARVFSLSLKIRDIGAAGEDFAPSGAECKQPDIAV
jgi:hypothetical protein